MTTSTTSPDRSRLSHILAAAFWLLLWQLAAMGLNQKILLVSPVTVILRLFELLPTLGFWSAVGFSFLRITLGFLLAAVFGTTLAALAARFSLVRALAAPPMRAVKSIPVASFIILVLLWVPSRNLSVVISFLMVLPVVYSNVLTGAESMDEKLTEMANVFQVPLSRRVRYLYLPQILPFFRSACAAGLGLCWKAGIAAEVIGLPDGSIGERLYEAKVYLETPDLFAWTLVIVLVSLLFEQLFLFLLGKGMSQLEKL